MSQTTSCSQLTLFTPDADTLPLAPTQALLATLERWAKRGWIRELDAAFARFLVDFAPDAAEPLILAATLASHQLGRGHACLDLRATLQDPALALSLPPDGLAEAGPDAPPLPQQVLGGLSLQQWCRELADARLVDDGHGSTPLVLHGHRLYLRRYWNHECAVRAGILARLQQPRDLTPEVVRPILDVLFEPTAPGAGLDWQKLACALAARSNFAVITGGPGTGKTTTVVRLLTLLQSLTLGDGTNHAPLRIRLAAPTGKAAARLSASIAGQVARLPLQELPGGEALRAHIPTEVTTVHRLLGSRPDTRHFTHHADNLLPVDVLVIDEASMVDLEMMVAVLAALPPAARLILLGDKDQLDSVEAGALLGELCARAADGHYTPASAQWLAQASGLQLPDPLIDPDGHELDQAIAMLRHSHRFSAASGIGQLAAAVNAGDQAQLAGIWQQAYPDLDRLTLRGPHDAAFTRLVIEGSSEPAAASRNAPASARVGYRHYLEQMQALRPSADADAQALDDWARAVLAAHGRFQLLCALRRGPWGVAGLNQQVGQMLLAAGLIPTDRGWYPGRPVLVTRNDYGLGLMNGDIGITLAMPGSDNAAPVLRVAFMVGEQRIRWVLPSRLQDVETVYALTVHKSQGSEFMHAALVLPDRTNPILSRELVYTGITRASHYLTLVESGREGLLAQAIARPVHRASGLRDDSGALAGP